jgi:hypothetical protein
MAGAITHLLVAERAAQELEDSAPGLAQILATQKSYLLLGSVSPDLPYLSIPPGGQSFWADQMHYRSTNQLVLQGAVEVGDSRLLPKPEGQAQLAWLAGFAAHCVTDATIHPIVQAIVGPYQANRDEHRRCEMTQDSLLFSVVKECDVCDSQFVDVLRRLEPPELRRKILDLWDWGLHAVYGDLDPGANPKVWLAGYSTCLNAAADSEVLLTLSRALHALEGYHYYSADAIRSKRQEDARKYFDAIPIPHRPGDTGSFLDRAFLRAVKHVLEVWVALWQDVQHSAEITDVATGQLHKVLKNWDLDTGADMDQFDPRVTYWPA